MGGRRRSNGDSIKNKVTPSPTSSYTSNQFVPEAPHAVFLQTPVEDEEPELPDWVIARCAPVLYLHPEEPYYPVSADWYLSRSRLDYTGPLLASRCCLNLPMNALAAAVSSPAANKYATDDSDASRPASPVEIFAEVNRADEGEEAAATWAGICFGCRCGDPGSGSRKTKAVVCTEGDVRRWALRELWRLEGRRGGHGELPPASTILREGEVTPERLVILQKLLGPGYLQLVLDPKYYVGCAPDPAISAPRTGDSSGPSVRHVPDVPIYVQAKRIYRRPRSLQAAACSGGEVLCWEISYITLYAYNGAYNLGGSCFKAGAHEGDWEHLTVRVALMRRQSAGGGGGDGGAPLALHGVWFNQHRSVEGEWCETADVLWEDEAAAAVAVSGASPEEVAALLRTTGEGGGDGVLRGTEPLAPGARLPRMCGFVAINGHGIYPRATEVPRLFFLANDRMGMATRWRPRRLVKLDLAAQELRERLGRRAVSRGCLLLPPTAAATLEPPLPHFASGPSPDPRAWYEVGSGTRSWSGAGSGIPDRTTRVTYRDRENDIEVVSDWGVWQQYKGQWGGVPSPWMGNWFRAAESPVSRSWAQRVFLPLSRGVLAVTAESGDEAAGQGEGGGGGGD